MKIKLMAALLATLSVNAFAGQNGDNVLDISGASAIQQNVAKAVASLCADAGGALTVFKGGAAVNAYDNRMAYVCSAPMAGTDITVVRHSVNGGSLNSVLAMLNNTTVQFVDLSSAGCAAAVAGAGDLSGFSVRAGCGRQDEVSDGGFSDVEWKLAPELFSTAGEAFMGNVTVDPVYVGQAFGVAVSKQLYEALQTAQGLVAGGCTLGDDSPACQPTISSSQMSSLINNNLFSSYKQGVGALVGSTDASPLTYCRRPATSGTQTATEVEFLGKTCRTGEQPGAQSVIDGGVLIGSAVQATASYNGGKFLVTTNSGTSDVRNCLNGATSGYKFGIVSAENEPLASGQTWRFVKLDGVSVSEGGNNPTNRLSVVKPAKALGGSNYKFAYEAVLHTNVADGVTGDEEYAVMKEIINKLKIPASIAGNGLTNRGLYQLPDGGYSNADAADEVALYQRGGSSANNCVNLTAQ